MKFDEVLRSWKDWFEQENIRYAVAGGLAIHAWGRSRSTQDVDFIVDAAAARRIRAHAEELGYRTLHVSTGYSNHEHPSEPMGRIDFIYVQGTTRDQIVRRRRATTDRGERFASSAAPRAPHCHESRGDQKCSAPRAGRCPGYRIPALAARH